MISMFAAAAISFTVSILGTPYAIRRLRSANIGQFIQEEVEGHSHKHGTPTMGGIVIIVAVVAGYVFSHVALWTRASGAGITLLGFTTGGGLAMLAFVGMGVIGFLDDYQKVRNERNLGLNKRGKFGGQLLIAAIFAFALYSIEFPFELSFTRSIGITLPVWLFIIWALFLLTAFANAVNFTDGLDGLASGSSALVFAAYMVITFWIFRNPDFYGQVVARELSALDLARFAAALLGATLGFLWWNAAPAKIFMGDVGSQSLGGGMAALALLTNTQLLLPVLGGLFVMEATSVVLQIASFRLFGKRIFRIAPIHHHFEMVNWPETTIIVRFWIIAAMCVAVGLGFFYGDFVTAGGIS
ncbi:MAG: phospho-N-acetylmuramoyl-pentapeptide-transferase [Acidimicrobiia bacterium]|nr:phospho-N-acetylmuramoyl-pentapeptide-transferase [Acidimicrobiia bacterium]